MITFPVVYKMFTFSSLVLLDLLKILDKLGDGRHFTVPRGTIDRFAPKCFTGRVTKKTHFKSIIYLEIWHCRVHGCLLVRFNRILYGFRCLCSAVWSGTAYYTERMKSVFVRALNIKLQPEDSFYNQKVKL